MVKESSCCCLLAGSALVSSAPSAPSGGSDPSFLEESQAPGLGATRVDPAAFADPVRLGLVAALLHREHLPFSGW